MRNYLLAASAAVLAVAAVPASAAIVIGTASAPASFVKIANPVGLTNVGNRTSENNGLPQKDVYGFDEKQYVTLGSALAAHLAPGGSTNAGEGLVAAGARVASHYFFFDPRGTAAVKGTISFNRNIIAIIRTTSALTASDPVLGIAGVGYQSVPGRGLEEGNSVTFAINGNTLSYDTRSANPGDSFRVLTGAVPEPATWAMMILGFGLVGASLRRRGIAHVSA
jgi:hypothetical protein